jgi:hypothetical protein
VAAALLIVPRARVVHEDAAHHAGGDGEKMRAVVPLDRFPVDQTDIGLVDERRRLKAVSDALPRHAAPRDSVELLMDERNQSLESALVALTPLEEQPGNLRRVFSDSAILGCFGPRSTVCHRSTLLASAPAQRPAFWMKAGPCSCLAVLEVC